MDRKTAVKTVEQDTLARKAQFGPEATAEWFDRETPRIQRALEFTQLFGKMGWTNSPQGHEFWTTVCQGMEYVDLDTDGLWQNGIVFLAGALWRESGGTMSMLYPNDPELSTRCLPTLTISDLIRHQKFTDLLKEESDRGSSSKLLENMVQVVARMKEPDHQLLEALRLEPAEVPNRYRFINE